jgi:hypothetical protein
MKERKVHFIGAGGLHQETLGSKILRGRFAKQRSYWIADEHSTLLYSYIWSLGVKSKGLPLNVK